MDQHMVNGISKSLKIGIEPIKAYRVEEITYEGNELYTESLSFNEYINNLSEKLNFSLKAHPNKEKAKEKSDKKWPWESIHEKLKNSLIEINVLSDILKITKQQQYLALDFITNENIENKPSLVLLSKKKALSQASIILLNGADRITSMQLSSATMSNQNSSNFHFELLNLRQNWRIKKIGQNIIGDLSFKSVGSNFKENGNFEVVKNQNIAKFKSTIQIVLPKPLEIEFCLKISLKIDGVIKKCSTSLNIHTLQHFNQIFKNKWHSKLETAQNNIFCKEIYYKLVAEMVQTKTQMEDHYVQGNSAYLSLFPGVILIVSLQSGLRETIELSSDNDSAGSGKVNEANYLRCLEFGLHAHLLNSYGASRRVDQAHPTCASLYDSCRKRLAGPQALKCDDGIVPATPNRLDDMDKVGLGEGGAIDSSGDDEEDIGIDRANYVRWLKLRRADQSQRYSSTVLLKPMVDMARHLYLRIRSLEAIDNLSRPHADPCFIVHSGALSDPYHSAFTINIVTKGYEALCRTSIYLQVFSDVLKAVLRDGRIQWLSSDPDDLSNLLLSQVAQHQINAVQSLSKLMNWQTLSNEPFNPTRSCATEVGPGISPTITLKSPNEKWTLNIQGARKPVVYLVPDNNVPKSLLKGATQMDLDKLPSQIFLSKIEYLMAFLKYL